MFIFKIIHCIHTQQSIKNVFTKPPVFPQFSSAPKTPVCGRRVVDTSFTFVTCQAIHQVLGWVPDLSSLPSIFLALQASDLWPTALLPSKPNSHLERIQNNLRWMKWEDLFYRWAFYIPSKLFLNEFLDSVWSWMPWSYWVIISSLRHCDFVRCLKEKVINILETVPDKLGNQMAAENLWNAD